MTLLKEIEEDKAQLAEAVEAEKEEPTEEVEESPEEPKEEEKTEEKPAEVKEEPKEEEKPDNSAFAKLRREAAANKKLADERATEIAELKKPREETEEPAPAAFELAEVLQDHRIGRAERQFKGFEAEVMRAAPENPAIMAEYTQALQGAIKLQNPRLPAIEIAELTKLELFRKAGKYQDAGYANPVGELLEEAKELGFTGKSFAKEEPAKDPKPDMNKVAENRKRSAGMTGTPGREDGLVSKKTAAEMTPAEWKSLDRAERARLMQA